jgi:DNA helicase-2/ATP-dependent DNA helicase PcrA
VSNEFHIYGPPGTGKTTTLIKNIGLAVEKHGAGKVMVCSFTKAAATEVINRGVPVQPNMIGTLHSLCFRGLEDPVIAESKAKEFNEDKSHGYSVTPKGKAGIDDIGEASGSSDDTLTHYQSFRARMIKRDGWPDAIKGFAHHWEKWKLETGYLDFNDLIEVARDTFLVAPGNPKVMFVDEAQDLNALQMSCIRKWGESMERLVLVGDDDQTIFRFTGADAANMIDRDIPEANKIILNQSYRVPRAVLQRADSWIKRVSHRQVKEYLPRDAEGEVRRMSWATWKNPEGVVADIVTQIALGKKTMVLASAAYILGPTIEMLRGRGLFFYNPYRITNGIWNPIRTGDGSVKNRILTYLRGDLSPEWTNHQLMVWTELIKAKDVLLHGARAAIKRDAEARPHDRAYYQAVFEPGQYPWQGLDPWSAIPEKALRWLSQNAAPAKSKGIKYIESAVVHHGKDYLFQPPKIVVGTVHSVKGGEADVVYLFPDLSRQAYDSNQDDITRVMYVGMTRARETLVIPDSVAGVAASI